MNHKRYVKMIIEKMSMDRKPARRSSASISQRASISFIPRIITRAVTDSS